MNKIFGIGFAILAVFSLAEILGVTEPDIFTTVQCFLSQSLLVIIFLLPEEKE